MIDDNLENAIDCASAGVRVFLLEQKWNHGKTLPYNVKRVFSWEEIVNKIG